MRKLLRGLGPLVLVAALTAFFVSAGASPPTVGTSVPDSALPVGSFTANTPFASGQNINVVIPANSVFSDNTNLAVIECSAPNAVIPTQSSACDGNTINGPTIKSNADGSVNFQTETDSLYTVYALPDSVSLGEGSGGPVCGNTSATECILYIGYNVNDFTQPHFWSQPFFIDTNATDTGTPAGDGSPPPVATTPSPTLSTAVASPSTNTANGKDVSIVTVTLLGTGSVSVTGKTVTLTGTGHSTMSPETAGSNVTNSQGVATFTVSDTTAETVTYTAVDTTDSVTLAAQPTVHFAAPVATNADSTVVASPTTVSSGSETTITVTIQDQGSPPQGVAGQTVSLAGSGSTVVVAPATTGSNVTNSSGVATFTATDTATELVTFTATDVTDSNLVLSSTAAVTFGSLVVSPSTSTVTATSPQPLGKGAPVTVTLLTAGGSPVSGKSVSLASPSATVSISGPNPATTGSNGQATFTVTDSVAESDTFTATDETDVIPITQTATVSFQTPVPSATSSSVVTETGTSVADGQTLTLVDVTINDQFGKPVAGKSVTLSATGSALVHSISEGGAAPGVTNADGVAFFEVDDTAAETVTLTATDTTDSLTVTQTAQIIYVAGAADPGASTSTVVASNVNPPSNGTTPTDLTVTLTDEFGNPVAGKTISLAALPSGNSAVIKTVNPVTNGEGQAVFTATDATAEVVTFRASDVTDGDVALTSEAVVTFGTTSTAPVPSATTSDVVLSRTLSPADGRTQTLIIVTVNDQFDNPVAGNVVELQGSGSVRTQGIVVDGSAPGVTDSSGIAEFVATDAVAEIVTYRVFDSSTGFCLADRPMETFQTPVPPASTPEIASPALLPLSAIAFGGIAYGINQIRRRKRGRQIAK